MGKRLAGFAAAAIRLFTRPMNITWEEPYQSGPCVFVVSRDGPADPALIAARFPLRDRCHMWIQNEMLETKTARAFIRREGWWRKGSFMEPVHRTVIPVLAGAAVPPVLRSLPHIPVYTDRRIMLTLRESTRVLRRDECVVIFPEAPAQAASGRRPWISTGFLRLGELGYRACGRALKFYPVRVNREKRLFEVGKPVRYDPARRFSEQEKEIADQLAAWLR